MQDMKNEQDQNKKPLRVLQIIGIICGGGVESVIMNYYRHIDRTKIQFDFVVDGFDKTSLDDEVEALGGAVYHVTPYQKNILAYVRDIAKIIRKNSYKIVHANMNTISAFPLFAAWMEGVPIRILHNHSMAVPNEGLRTVMKNILRPFAKLFANRCFACSKAAGEWMYGRRMMERDRVKIIHNAIDLDVFAYREDIRNALREELSISRDAFVIGHVGRFMFPKNHAFLLDVFSEVHKMKNNSLLLLVGDGDLRRAMEEKAKKLHIEEHVRFLGLRHDVAKLYNAMDIFVMPSWYEGLPVVAVEAQANGLPCLLSDRISKESHIADNIDFLNLEAGSRAWAEKLSAYPDARDISAAEKLRACGFDIKNEAVTLEAYYFETFASFEAGCDSSVTIGKESCRESE